MTKRMLIDATHPEETRVAVADNTRLEEYDCDSASKKTLKGNIYLAKVTWVAPSLQAAFVDYGEDRHGFLPFSEIHPDYFRIPVDDLRKMEETMIAEEEEKRRKKTKKEAPLTIHVEGESTAPPLDDLSETPPPKKQEGASSLSLEEGDIATEFEAEKEVSNPEVKWEGDDTVEEVSEEKTPAKKKKTASKTAASKTASPKPRRPRTQKAKAPEGESAVPSEETEEKEKPKPRPRKKTAQARTSDPVAVLEGEDLEDLEPAPRRLPYHRMYKIQEVIKRNQIILVQVVKEERGEKGAAMTSYVSLAGRYCVLKPNSPQSGGISRKIASPQQRQRLRQVMDELKLSNAMSMIIRTAGRERSKPEIKRDAEYLFRVWDRIREQTMSSIAPALIHEEADLIKRAIRDIYTKDIEEIFVAGEEAYRSAKEFIKILIPSHAKRVVEYKDEKNPLFYHYGIETQIDNMLIPRVELPSGGYLIINPTEALVSIDINSGRATRERDITDTALKTNLEAAEEIARQLRLRDLAGLIVIDFIDMDHHDHVVKVERKMREAVQGDRARIQLGSISMFGLMEMSRQRLRPSITETSSISCPQCQGAGVVRSIKSAALEVLRGVESTANQNKMPCITARAPLEVAFYLLNEKRGMLSDIETRHKVTVKIEGVATLTPPQFEILGATSPNTEKPVVQTKQADSPQSGTPSSEGGSAKRPRRRSRQRRDREGTQNTPQFQDAPSEGNVEKREPQTSQQPQSSEAPSGNVAPTQRPEGEERSSRGRRGGRRRGRRGQGGQGQQQSQQQGQQQRQSQSRQNQPHPQHQGQPRAPAPQKDVDGNKGTHPSAEATKTSGKKGGKSWWQRIID